MSIKILTIKEAEETKKRAMQYGEVCEMITGKAKSSYFCDNSGEKIDQGSECAVVLVLPSRDHFNYDHQKAMLQEYVQ